MSKLRIIAVILISGLVGGFVAKPYSSDWEETYHNSIRDSLEVATRIDPENLPLIVNLKNDPCPDLSRITKLYSDEFVKLDFLASSAEFLFIHAVISQDWNEKGYFSRVRSHIVGPESSSVKKMMMKAENYRQKMKKTDKLAAIARHCQSRVYDFAEEKEG